MGYNTPKLVLNLLFKRGTVSGYIIRVRGTYTHNMQSRVSKTRECLGSFPLTVTVTTMGYRTYKNPLNKAPLRTVTGRGNDPKNARFRTSEVNSDLGQTWRA